MHDIGSTSTCRQTKLKKIIILFLLRKTDRFLATAKLIELLIFCPCGFILFCRDFSYYINYLTKAMQLEDPRIRYRQLQNEHTSTESIPLQTASQVSFFCVFFSLQPLVWPWPVSSTATLYRFYKYAIWMKLRVICVVHEFIKSIINSVHLDCTWCVCTEHTKYGRKKWILPLFIIHMTFSTIESNPFSFFRLVFRLC